MKRAVWLPNWIGDAVMATPALKHLRHQDPDGQLIGICRRPVNDLMTVSSVLDSLYLDRTGKGCSWSERWAFIRKLRRERFDEIVLFTNSLRTAAIARMMGVPRRSGFFRDGRTWLLTDGLKPFSKTKPNPVIDEYNRLAAHVSGQELDDRNQYQLELQTTNANQLQWSEFATARGLADGQYVCFNSGGAFGAAKHWPLESFINLAIRIVHEQQIPVVMLCGPAERELAREFAERSDHPLIHSICEEELSVGFSMSLVQHAGWMITTDSGPRHFAQAFDVPVLTIYGPTHIAWSHTYYEHAIASQLELDCGPCQQRVCPLKHHRCMRDLSVDRVYRDFLKLQHRAANPATDQPEAA